MVITAITNTAAATVPPTTPDSAETATLGNTTKLLYGHFLMISQGTHSIEYALILYTVYLVPDSFGSTADDVCPKSRNTECMMTHPSHTLLTLSAPFHPYICLSVCLSVIYNITPHNTRLRSYFRKNYCVQRLYIL